jgi:hypothetical protein
MRCLAQYIGKHSPAARDTAEAHNRIIGERSQPATLAVVWLPEQGVYLNIMWVRCAARASSNR